VIAIKMIAIKKALTAAKSDRDQMIAAFWTITAVKSDRGQPLWPL
jgi:hypothetical protein